MRDLRLSQRCCWECEAAGMWCRVVLSSSRVNEGAIFLLTVGNLWAPHLKTLAVQLTSSQLTYLWDYLYRCVTIAWTILKCSSHQFISIHVRKYLLWAVGTKACWPLPWRYFSAGALDNPSVFISNWKWTETSSTRFLCLSIHSQVPRDVWDGATVHVCIASGWGYFENLLWTVIDKQ